MKLYSASRLDELGMLAVCDRLVELHHRGGLPIAATGTAAGLLDAFWLGRAERLTEDERRALYARGLGLDFESLLGELAAALAAHRVDPGHAEVAAAAAKLRSTIDAHVESARTDVELLMAQLADAEALLSDRELLSTYGARDLMELFDHLSRLALGGTRHLLRSKSLLEAGAMLLLWLDADDPDDLAIPAEVLDAAEAWLTAAAMPSD